MTTHHIATISSSDLDTVTGGFEGLVPQPGDPEHAQALAVGMTAGEIKQLGKTIADQIPVNDRATTAWDATFDRARRLHDGG